MDRHDSVLFCSCALLHRFDQGIIYLPRIPLRAVMSLKLALNRPLHARFPCLGVPSIGLFSPMSTNVFFNAFFVALLPVGVVSTPWGMAKFPSLCRALPFYTPNHLGMHVWCWPCTTVSMFFTGDTQVVSRIVLNCLYAQVILLSFRVLAYSSKHRRNHRVLWHQFKQDLHLTR